MSVSLKKRKLIVFDLTLPKKTQLLTLKTIKLEEAKDDEKSQGRSVKLKCVMRGIWFNRTGVLMTDGHGPTFLATKLENVFTRSWKTFSIIMNNIKSASVTLLTKELLTQSFINTSLIVLFLHWTEFYFRDINNCIYWAFFVRTSVKYR